MENCPHFTPLSLDDRVGVGVGVGGHDRVKRESLGRAGGLQTGARPRRSADDRMRPQFRPAWLCRLFLLRR
jgi:hypothetical protein